MAYCIPAVSVGGEAKVAVKLPPAPLVLNGTDAEARSAPVGRLPDAFLMETVTFGGLPVQAAQNKFTSTRVACPVTPAVKVCAHHLVLLKPNPFVESVVFC